MHDHSKMPMCDDYTGKMKEVCMHEWMDSPSGRQYKNRYDQLKMEMDNIMRDIDSHVHNHMKSKYGMVE